jgi:hypothetical protein
LNARRQGTVEAIVERALDDASKERVRAAERMLRLLAAAFDDQAAVTRKRPREAK